MPARARDEEGFGLVELLFAMVLLNVGILALVAAFSSGAFALSEASSASNGSAVADKVMEVYRDLENCGIYLQAGTGLDVGGWPDGIPQSGSAFYDAYRADEGAYADVDYYDAADPSSTPLWVTQSTAAGAYPPIPASSSSCLPSGLTLDPTRAVQSVQGPDGQDYTVFVYIVAVQPSGGGYVKQVTVVVHDPQHPSRVLARESSLFAPS